MYPVAVKFTMEDGRPYWVINGLIGVRRSEDDAATLLIVGGSISAIQESVETVLALFGVPAPSSH